MATTPSSVLVFAVLFSAATLGAAQTSKSAQLGRHMLQIGINGAAYARTSNSECLVGPGCGENRARESSPSPPDPRNGRHLLSQLSKAAIAGSEQMGRQILQLGFNGAAYVHTQNSRCLVGPGCGENRDRQSSPSPPDSRNGRHLLNDTVGRQLLQNGVNGAAYVRPSKTTNSVVGGGSYDNRETSHRDSRNLLQHLTGLH